MKDLRDTRPFDDQRDSRTTGNYAPSNRVGALHSPQARGQWAQGLTHWSISASQIPLAAPLVRICAGS